MAAKPKRDMFEQLAEVLGEKAAEGLCAAWGGLRVYVPASVDDRHPIYFAIGLQAAKRLCERWSGETLTVPKLDRLRRAKRNQQIVEEYRAGATGSQIARKYGLHEGSVYQLIAQLDARRQQDLFGR